METEDITMICSSEPFFLTFQKSQSTLSLNPLTDPQSRVLIIQPPIFREAAAGTSQTYVVKRGTF